MSSLNVVARISGVLKWRLARLRDRMTLTHARIHRGRLKDTTFVGITGSAGKTTTKDLALAVLGRRGPVSGNAASLNYVIDLAKVITTTKPSDRFAIVEIAVNAPGSIDAKVALARPSIAALTVVQRDHIKNFDSVEDIANEKGKLILALPPDGTAVLNMDDSLVRRVGEHARAKRIWFGRAEEADIRLIDATSAYPDPLTLVIEYRGKQYRCATGLHGTHLEVPVLAAIGLGLAAEVPIQECIDALAEAETTPGRMQIAPSTGGVTFIRDDYKTPYWAFAPTIDYLANAKATRKVAIIGTLSDYSLSASKLYPKVARQAMAVADLVVFVGPHALRALKARRNDEDRTLLGFTEIEEADRFLQSELRNGDLVLLKGSNRADHLVRLYLARSGPVTCWISGCGLNRFCDACPHLAEPDSVEEKPSEQKKLPGVLNANAPNSSEPTALRRPTTQKTETTDAWLFVGLGNPGDTYVGTPHNIGFEAVDHLAQQLNLSWIEDQDGLLCHGSLDNQKIIVLKPNTLINLCGPAVERVRHRVGVSSDRVIVFHDESDLPLGAVRVKESGSDGGHKGLRSLFQALGNDGFMSRVRIGIRQPNLDRIEARSVVLRRLEPEAAFTLHQAFDEAVSLVRIHLNSR